MNDFEIDRFIDSRLAQMADNMAHCSGQIPPRTQILENLPGRGHTRLAMLFCRSLLVICHSWAPPQIMEVGGCQNDRRVALFLVNKLLGISGDTAGMTTLLKVTMEVSLHLDSDPVFEEIISLGEKLRRKFTQALFGKPAVDGTGKIHFRVDHLFPAMPASSTRLVFKELHITAAFGTWHREDGSWLPITGILSRTFHHSSPAISEFPRFIEILVPFCILASKDITPKLRRALTLVKRWKAKPGATVPRIGEAITNLNAEMSGLIRLRHPLRLTEEPCIDGDSAAFSTLETEVMDLVLTDPSWLDTLGAAPVASGYPTLHLTQTFRP